MAKHNYCSIRHAAYDWRKRTIQSRAGRFAAALREYMEGFARTHYKPLSLRTIQSRLLLFFEYLNRVDIRSIRRVSPQTVTDFIQWCLQQGVQKSRVTDTLATVAVFFKWSLMTGRRKGETPIMPRFHKLGRVERMPRPFTEDEMERIWKILQERGTIQHKLAVAMGEESGLRISEVCNVRLSDIDLNGRRIFVRLPNKTDRERWALFYRKTHRYLLEWLTERDPSCGHDHLFLNTREEPLRTFRLAGQLRELMEDRRGGMNGRSRVGAFTEFKYHRLRHTMASRLANNGADAPTIMAVGGWVSFKMVRNYVGLLPQTVQRSYDKAMARSVRAKKPRREESTAGTAQHLGQLRFAAACV